MLENEKLAAAEQSDDAGDQIITKKLRRPHSFS